MGAESYISHNNKVIFLDRDGVINRCPPPHQYVTRWQDFCFLSGVPEAIRLFNMFDYRVVIITNQRGIARGILTMKQLEKIHNIMRHVLEHHKAFVDEIFVCPHENGVCSCRKPGTGLFLCAEKMFAVDKPSSWMIGGSQSGILAGRRYGIKTILIGQGDFGQDISCRNLLDAARFITGGSI